MQELQWTMVGGRESSGREDRGERRSLELFLV